MVVRHGYSWLVLLLLAAAPALSHQTERLVFSDARWPFTVAAGNTPDSPIIEQGLIYVSGPSAPSHEAFSRIVVVGTASDSFWTVQARVHEGGRWSGWLRLDRAITPEGKFWARLIHDAPEGSRVEIRLQAEDRPGSLTGSIRLNLAYVVPLSRSEESASPVTLRAPSVQTTNTGCVDPPPVITREQWGAVPPAGTQVSHTPYRFTLHHTATNRCTTFAQGAAEARFIQDLHINGNGWKDIGYHYLVDDSGRIYCGVPDTIVGTHAANANTGNIGVSMMGLFSDVPPPPLMVDAVQKLYASLAERFGCTPDSLYGHRDYVLSTECPGDSGYSLLKPLRDGIRQALACGGPYVTDPFPQPFSRNIDVYTAITFHLRDDLEGINPSTVKIFVDGSQISPTSVAGSPNHYYIVYGRAMPFAYSHTVTVTIQASDKAIPPKVLEYTYTFATQTPVVVAETNGPASVSNATLSLQGAWSNEMFESNLPELSSGGSLIVADSAGPSAARIYPHLARSGNYIVSATTGLMILGANVRYRCVNSVGLANEYAVEYNTTFANTWGQLGRTPVYLEAGSPSSGYIEILPGVNHWSLLVVDAFRFEERDPLEPPSAPELSYVRWAAQNDIDVCWVPSLEQHIVGYRVYLSADGRTWGGPAVDETVLGPRDTTWRFTPPVPDAPMYVRITVVKNPDSTGGPGTGLESLPSDIYGASRRGTTRVLIVDNFDRQASWSLPTHFFVRSYGDGLRSYGTGFESCSNDAVQSGRVRLEDYEAVIYFCGDDSDREESVSETELVMLHTFLASGGRLMISGSEIAYDLGRSGRPDEFYLQMLFRAAFGGDDSGVHTCEGAAGSIFDGLTFEYGAESSETYVEDWPDYILPVNGSDAVLFYQGATTAAVAYDGLIRPDATEPARVVYCAFPVETIVEPSARAEFLRRVLNYFGIPVTPSDVAEHGVPQEFRLEQNYPNPFNGETVIQYAVAAAGAQGSDARNVRLAVYDMLGREVVVLVDEKKAPGVYQVTWNAGRLATGVYVYQLSAGQSVRTRKLVLLK